MKSIVNAEITDSVTQTNVKKGGDAPAMALDPVVNPGTVVGSDPEIDIEAVKRKLQQLRR